MRGEPADAGKLEEQGEQADQEQIESHPSVRAGHTLPEFNAEHSVADPIWMVRRFERGDDREVVAFIAAALAFGRVQSVLNSIEGMLR